MVLSSAGILGHPVSRPEVTRLTHISHAHVSCFLPAVPVYHIQLMYVRLEYRSSSPSVLPLVVVILEIMGGEISGRLTMNFFI